MLSGNRVAILVEEGFEDSELTEPMRALKDAGVKVVVVGTGSQEAYHGKRDKAVVKENENVVDVKPDDFDAVVIPGGYAPDRMRLCRPMVDLVREMHYSGKIVAAICHGPQMLISADIVRGKQVTSWESIAVDLENAGAKWIDQAVVQDGNIITSRKPADIPRFNKTIIETLERRYGRNLENDNVTDVTD